MVASGATAVGVPPRPVTCTREEEFTLLLVLRYYLLPGISGNAAVLSSAPLPELVHTEGFRRPLYSISVKDLV